jgi:hypothetical protein
MVTVVTLQIMTNTQTHSLDTSEKESMRHKDGDIIGVHITKNLATKVGSDWKWNTNITSPRSMFMHVTNVPLNVAKKIKERLTAPICPASETFRMSKFIMPPRFIPTALLNKMLSDKEATITYTDMKSLVRKKSIVALLDPSQDDETAQLVDGDLL